MCYFCVLFFDIKNLPQLILQISFSIVSGDITTITIFSFILSLISIVSSTFEYISLQYLLQHETILSITFCIESNDIAQMNSHDFKQLTNYRRSIAKELSKYFEINYRVIEILRPIQTRNGINITFHIRISIESSDTGHEDNASDRRLERNDENKKARTRTTSTVLHGRNETENEIIVNMIRDNQDRVCQIIFNKWKHRFAKFQHQAKVISSQIREMRPSGKKLSLGNLPFRPNVDVDQLVNQIANQMVKVNTMQKVASDSTSPKPQDVDMVASSNTNGTGTSSDTQIIIRGDNNTVQLL